MSMVPVFGSGTRDSLQIQDIPIPKKYPDLTLSPPHALPNSLSYSCLRSDMGKLPLTPQCPTSPTLAAPGQGQAALGIVALGQGQNCPGLGADQLWASHHHPSDAQEQTEQGCKEENHKKNSTSKDNKKHEFSSVPRHALEARFHKRGSSMTLDVPHGMRLRLGSMHEAHGFLLESS